MDPIADMLTIIRNGQAARKPAVVLPFSKVKAGVAKLLAAEGFLTRVQTVERDARQYLKISLRYHENGRPFIQSVQRVSTPGRRVYRGYQQLRRVRNGLGIAVLSTSHGMMTDAQARAAKAGGEVLCEIY